MAEQVQATLDRMVAPLADLMDREIFSQSEIHAIVARRRESEYLLKRITPRKADFLKYIQDELQLEKLRQLRAKKQQALERDRLSKLGRLDDENNNMTNKNHIGDFHIIQNIHLLFRRTLRKYDKEDVSIFLQYADVCKQLKSWNKLPEVYEEAMQIHPHCVGLWIEAASHEFFHRQSVSTARVLLQRALRINKTNKDLWWQSFALEYHHIAKMKGRRAVLKGTNPTEEAEDNDLNSSLFAVAKIVYDKAIEAIPDDVTFRLGFLDLCKTFPYTDSMEAHVYKTIRRDFSDQPKAWIARAAHILEQQQQQLAKESGNDEGANVPQGFTVLPEKDSGDDESDNDSDSDNDEDSEKEPAKKKRKSKHESSRSEETHEDPVLATIQKANRVVEASKMALESVEFLWSYWEKVEDIFTDTGMIGRTRKNILVFLQEFFHELALKNDFESYNVSVALKHAEYYVRVDQIEEARIVVADFLEKALEQGGKEKDAMNLTSAWMTLADLTGQVQSIEEAGKILKQALKNTPMSKPDYLILMLNLFGAELTLAKQQVDTSETTRKQVTDVFQKILLLSSSGSIVAFSEDTNSVVSAFGVSSVAQACYHFLAHCVDTLGPLSGSRIASRTVMLQSNFLDSLDPKCMPVEDVQFLVGFVDKCLEIEIDYLKKIGKTSGPERKKAKVHLRQLYDAAIRLFSSVQSLASTYQQRRNEATLL